MPTIQNVGSLAYDRARSSTTIETTLNTTYDIITPPGPNQTSEDVYFDLDPTTVAQVDTLTISAGVADDLYTVSIGDGTTTDIYTYRQEAGDTDAIVAASLAQLLDLHPGVRAVAAAAVITITGAHGGETITIDPSASTTPGNAVVASVTAASGTPLYVKVANITTTKELTSNGTLTGFPRFTMTTTFYDGDDTTPVVLLTKPIYTTGPRSLNEIQVNNGILQPV